MPTSVRRRRLDPRLVVGLVLVVASVGGVTALIASLDDTTVVYAAAHDLAVGERVTAKDLTLAEVRLGSAEAGYVRGEDLPDDLVAVRPVADGELVPWTALGDAGDLDVTSVVVPSTSELAAGVVAGARVDVWAAPRTEGGEYGPPRVLVAKADVARAIESSAFGGGGQTSVEIVVPRDDVGLVLDAVAGQAAISLVPSDRPAADR